MVGMLIGIIDDHWRSAVNQYIMNHPVIMRYNKHHPVLGCSQ